jgi:hypothetical protein
VPEYVSTPIAPLGRDRHTYSITVVSRRAAARLDHNIFLRKSGIQDKLPPLY